MDGPHVFCVVVRVNLTIPKFHVQLLAHRPVWLIDALSFDLCHCPHKIQTGYHLHRTANAMNAMQTAKCSIIQWNVQTFCCITYFRIGTRLPNTRKNRVWKSWNVCYIGISLEFYFFFLSAFLFIKTLEFCNRLRESINLLILSLLLRSLFYCARAHTHIRHIHRKSLGFFFSYDARSIKQFFFVLVFLQSNSLVLCLL